MPHRQRKAAAQQAPQAQPPRAAVPDGHLQLIRADMQCNSLSLAVLQAFQWLSALETTHAASPSLEKELLLLSCRSLFAGWQLAFGIAHRSRGKAIQEGTSQGGRDPAACGGVLPWFKAQGEP